MLVQKYHKYFFNCGTFVRKTFNILSFLIRFNSFIAILVQKYHKYC